MSLQVLINILQDESFGNDFESKIRHYAERFPLLVKKHPMSLIFVSACSDDVNDCVKLVYFVSKFYDHETIKPSSEQIMVLIDAVSDSKKTNLETIFDCENEYFETIIGIPLIFFKACNEREHFNRDHLRLMLNEKDRVEAKELSQHDASVNIGTYLVDTYVKPVIDQ